MTDTEIDISYMLDLEGMDCSTLNRYAKKLLGQLNIKNFPYPFYCVIVQDRDRRIVFTSKPQTDQVPLEVDIRVPKGRNLDADSVMPYLIVPLDEGWLDTLIMHFFGLYREGSISVQLLDKPVLEKEKQEVWMKAMQLMAEGDPSSIYSSPGKQNEWDEIFESIEKYMALSSKEPKEEQKDEELSVKEELSATSEEKEEEENDEEEIEEEDDEEESGFTTGLSGTSEKETEESKNKLCTPICDCSNCCELQCKWAGGCCKHWWLPQSK
jgi:hypothetical protein